MVVEAVEIEPGGKFHVSGQARPGAALRLYLNDSFVTSVTAGADGRFAVTINEGVAPGNYRVRLDEASSSGTVRARAEVPFTVPDTTVSMSAQATASRRADTAAPRLAAAGATVVPDAARRPPPWSCRRSRPPPFPAATASGASASSPTARARAMP